MNKIAPVKKNGLTTVESPEINGSLILYRKCEIKSPSFSTGLILIEVLIAIAILSIATVALLGKRVEIIHEAEEIRNNRIMWMLASQKMAEIQISKDVVAGEEIYTNSGDFEQYPGFKWDVEIKKEKIIIGNKEDQNNKPKEIYRGNLTITPPNMKEEDGLHLQWYFPMPVEIKK